MNIAQRLPDTASAIPARIAKHLSARVPRYTSYPTAPHFRAGFAEAKVRSWLAALEPGAPLSLYLHVPYCRELCWYCGCNMKLAARYQPVAAYTETLLAEITMVADAMGARHAVSHIHWGGGTPTILSAADFARVDALLRTRFDVLPDAEIAVEIDPRTLTQETVAAIRAMGCNRASLGVQEFDPAVQKAVNRVQPFETVARTVAWLRDAGISGLNFDLIYGLPHQTRATLDATIDAALTLEPDRLAIFGYAHVPWMAKKQRLIDEAALPSAEERFIMAARAGDRLVAKGYEQVGIDHFALAGDALARAAAGGHLRRNFQGYTTDSAVALIGFGASAISALPQGYAQNAPETNVYARAIAEGRLGIAKGLTLTEEDRWRRDVIERLMCDFRVDLGAIGRAHSLPWGAFSKPLRLLGPLVEDGLVESAGATLFLTDAGRSLARIVAAAFDAYLPASAEVRRHATV